jgi:hypothetical protein
MEVGPSAAPMMPIEAAWRRSKPSRAATAIVAKMPNWAAAPKSRRKGRTNRGVKSIIAPMAMKMSSGKASVAMPARKKSVRAPSGPTADESGTLTSSVPNHIGRSSVGSYSFAMAR